jgi:subtilisin family serine protease
MRSFALACAAALIAAGPSFARQEVNFVERAGAALNVELGAADSIVPDAIIVRFNAAATQRLADFGLGAMGFTLTPSLDAIGQRVGVSDIRPQFPGAAAQTAARGLPDLSGYHVVTFNPALAGVEAALAAYRADPQVISAEPIGIHPILAMPNDGSYPSQWHLNQANDKDMDAPEGWNLETGDPAIVVAVLDSGVRYYHKDLGGSNASAANPTGADGNIWINLAEKNGVAGVDDDGNSYVDDWVGYDFVNGATPCWSGEDCNGIDNDPRDFNGHGTHCAGNVAAINNNAYATASPAGGWNSGAQAPAGNGVKVMCLRMGWSGSQFGQEVGYVRMDYAASAFYYAANNGANIASCSWGSSNSGGIAAAIDYFVASGGLVFVAAGNANNQTAGYVNSRSDCFSVAATNQSDQKASFSSYGSWVDISAPGVAILSSYHDHGDPTPDYVATIDGTSMATPLVASVAAAVWSRQPTWTAAQVWARVRDTADNINSLNPSYVGLLGSGRVNLFNAVNTGPGCTDNSQCDDGVPCNGVETCVAGSCVAGSITDCNNNSIDDACDISGGSSLDCNGNLVPDECEGGDPCSPGETLLLAFTSATTLPSIGTVQNEDIAQYNTAGAGTWSLYFDGSDVGLASFDIDALAVLPDGDLLISTSAAGTVGSVSFDDSDILRFEPTSLGSTTAGTWSLYFDGSDVGLSSNSEDVDAVALAPDGRLVISTSGNPSVTGLSSLGDEDLIIFTATSLGSTTAGTWGYHVDGSDVSLSQSSENIDGVSILSNGLISLSTTGNFSVSGLSGANEDVFDFAATSLGSTTAGSFAAFFVGVNEGVPSGADVAAVHEID